MLQKSQEIAVDPVLLAKHYCFIIGYPDWGEWSVQCEPPNSTYWLKYWKNSPIGMMRDNISLSVFNATLAFLSLVFGIFGNILITVAILTKKELKSSTNLLLLGMAVADCLNSITVVFHAYLDTFMWRLSNAVLGPVGCALLSTVKQFTQLAAVNHLITLSFERYFAICWPMNQSLKFTKRKTVLMIIFNWILAAVQAIPHLILNYSLTDQHLIEYFCHKTAVYEDWIYVVYSLSVYLVLPLPILCFNYISVVRSLLTSIKRSRQMTGDASGQTMAEKARLKLSYMMITLVAIYIVTVAPGRILHSFVKLDGNRTFPLIYFKKIDGSLDLVRGMNSWTNVVVYAIISRQFRTAFREILCYFWRKPSQPTSRSGDQHGMNETPAATMENQV